MPEPSGAFPQKGLGPVRVHPLRPNAVAYTAPGKKWGCTKIGVLVDSPEHRVFSSLVCQLGRKLTCRESCSKDAMSSCLCGVVSMAGNV